VFPRRRKTGILSNTLDVDKEKGMEEHWSVLWSRHVAHRLIPDEFSDGKRLMCRHRRPRSYDLTFESRPDDYRKCGICEAVWIADGHEGDEG